MRPVTAISSAMCILTLATVAAAIEQASLPAVWQVKLDPDDLGLKERWNAVDLDDSDWTALRADDWEGWENQGLMGESDLGWYRVRYEVPEALESKKHVYLYFNCVDEQAWVWLNGREVGEHTLLSEGLVGSMSERRDGMWVAPFALEMQEHLRGQGPDVFAVRVKRGGDAGGGIWKPVYLFASDTPLELGEMTSRAKAMNARTLEAKEPTVQYEVWTTNPYDPIYPDTEGAGQVKIEEKGVGASQAHSLTDTIRTSGACGEYVPIAIHVRNHGDATLPVRFDLAGVRHEQTELRLRTDRVQVHFVDYILTPSQETRARSTAASQQRQWLAPQPRGDGQFLRADRHARHAGRSLEGARAFHSLAQWPQAGDSLRAGCGPGRSAAAGADLGHVLVLLAVPWLDVRGPGREQALHGLDAASGHERRADVVPGRGAATDPE